MKDKNFNNPVILVAPMDWGLGHATRCIPIITRLLAQNCRVIIAASGPGRALLQKEFPGLLCLELPGYNIRYNRRRGWFALALISQLPRISKTIKQERAWLKKTINEYSIDAVISDNRMGLHDPSIPCIYITHQLQIKTGYSITDWFARKIHSHFIHKFTECWVPDNKTGDDLTGELAHPKKLPSIPVKYIGPLSRFKKAEEEKKYDVAVILSGPEPQRTIFEELVLKDISHVPGNSILVRGLPDLSPVKINASSGVEIKDHLNAGELNRVLLQSALVIGRCGYSSIMDLLTLHKKAVLVPTPGQTEQEYLGNYLSKKKLLGCMDQEDFSLPAAIKMAESFSFTTTPVEVNAYYKEIDQLLNTLAKDQQ